MEKAKQFLKKNWTFIVIAILVFIVVLSLYKNYTSNSLYEGLMEQYSSQKTNYEKQIKEIESINKTALKEKQEQEKFYQEQIKEIEEKYSLDVKKLNKKLTQQKNDLVVQGNENPNFLLDKLIDVYQIEKFEGKIEQCRR